MAETTETAPLAAARNKRRLADPAFFLIMTLILAGIIFSGFWQTFYLRAFIEPHPFFTDDLFTPWLYVHGSLLTAWFVLLIAQSTLVNAGNVKLHRRMGVFGMGIAVAAVITVVPVLLQAPARFVRAGMPVEEAVAFSTMIIWLDVMNLLGFITLVGWAWLRRRDGAFHKRLLIIASISLMPPALFRALSYFPGVPGLPVALGIVLGLILAVAVWDFVRLRRVHPATLWAAGITVLGYVLGFAVATTGPAKAFVAGLV